MHFINYSSSGGHDSVVTSFRLRDITEDSTEMRKIRKDVQRFLRGWLCRRRWKQIVEQYIKSSLVESMRIQNRQKLLSIQIFARNVKCDQSIKIITLQIQEQWIIVTRLPIFKHVRNFKVQSSRRAKSQENSYTSADFNCLKKRKVYRY